MRIARIIAGTHTNARQVASPNHDARPTMASVCLLVLHGITVPDGELGGDGIEQLFTNQITVAALAGAPVSAHFLLRRNGELVQFVNCNRRAWHAGTSCWNGQIACNDFSIGVELEGTDALPYTDDQYADLVSLISLLRSNYQDLTAIAGHCHIATTRKTDPGTTFDWQRLFTAVGTQLDGRKHAG